MRCPTPAPAPVMHVISVCATVMRHSVALISYKSESPYTARSTSLLPASHAQPPVVCEQVALDEMHPFPHAFPIVQILQHRIGPKFAPWMTSVCPPYVLADLEPAPWYLLIVVNVLKNERRRWRRRRSGEAGREGEKKGKEKGKEKGEKKKEKKEKSQIFPLQLTTNPTTTCNSRCHDGCLVPNLRVERNARLFNN